MRSVFIGPNLPNAICGLDQLGKKYAGVRAAYGGAEGDIGKSGLVAADDPVSTVRQMLVNHGCGRQGLLPAVLAPLLLDLSLSSDVLGRLT